jgi:hypothetical protein
MVHHSSESLKRVTLILVLLIVGCLSIAALGGIFETHLLVNFWYLALLGIGAMFLLTALLAVGWMLSRLSRRYRHMLIQWGDGVPGH